MTEFLIFCFLKDPVSDSRAYPPRTHRSEGELGPRLILKVDGTHTPPATEAKVQPSACCYYEVRPVREVVREIEVGETDHAFDVGLKSIDIEVISGTDHVAFGMYALRGVILEPSSFAFDAESTG